MFQDNFKFRKNLVRTGLNAGLQAGKAAAIALVLSGCVEEQFFTKVPTDPTAGGTSAPARALRRRTGHRAGTR
jgi:hypothetical protein